MKTHKKFCFACVILLLACGMAVAGDQEKKKSKEGKSEERGESSEGKSKGRVESGITDHEREVIREYYAGREKHDKDGKRLPPGLAKKVARGGKLPPGWEKKMVKGE